MMARSARQPFEEEQSTSEFQDATVFDAGSPHGQYVVEIAPAQSQAMHSPEPRLFVFCIRVALAREPDEVATTSC